MAKILCWEEKPDGRYCKNYRLKSKNKCHSHHVPDDIYLNVLTKLVFIMVIGYIYIDNKEHFDSYYQNDFQKDFDIVYNTFKEYLFQLTKIDKNTTIFYMKSIGLILIRYYRILSMYMSRLL